MTLAAPHVHEPFVVPLGPVSVSGFGIAVALGFVIGDVIGRRELARRGHDPAPVTDVVMVAVIGFLIGAKLYYVVLTGEPSAIWSRGGLVFWGGLVGGVLAGIWMTLRRGVPIMRMADVAGIGIAAGYAVGRTGCWAVGDDYGRPWDSPLAVAFPDGVPPSTAANLRDQFGIPIPPGTPPDAVLAVHPTQLYETALGFAMFYVLWRLRDHRHAEGWLFGAYLVLAGLERFLIEFLRAKDDRLLGPLTVAQVIALAIAAAGVLWMHARRAPSAGAPGIYATTGSREEGTGNRSNI